MEPQIARYSENQNGASHIERPLHSLAKPFGQRKSEHKKWLKSGSTASSVIRVILRKCLIPKNLPRMDSNHDKVIQSHLCYRYTTRQLCGRIE